MSLLEVGEIFIVSLVNTTIVVLGKTYMVVWLGGADEKYCLVSMVSLGVMGAVIMIFVVASLVPVVDNAIGALVTVVDDTTGALVTVVDNTTGALVTVVDNTIGALVTVVDNTIGALELDDIPVERTCIQCNTIDVLPSKFMVVSLELG